MLNNVFKMKVAIPSIMPWSHLHVKQYSRNGSECIPRGNYGVYVVITGYALCLREGCLKHPITAT